MASIIETGRSERQNVSPPATGATIGAGWYERTRQTLKWAVSDREYFHVYRSFGAAGAYESLSRSQVKRFSFNTKVDPWNMCDVDSGGSTVRIPEGRARGWWLFTGQVWMGGGTTGSIGTAPAYDLAYGEIVLIVNGSENIIARDEQWRWRTTPCSLMPYAMVSLEAFAGGGDIEVQLRGYQSGMADAGYCVVWLKGVHLHSHSSEMSGALGSTSWVTPTRWTSGTLDLAGELAPLANAVEHLCHDRPAVELYSATTVSVPNATNVLISTWNDLSDTRNWANNSRITIGEQGYYLVTAVVAFPAGATGGPTYHVVYLHNGTEFIGLELVQIPAGAGPRFVTVSGMASFFTGGFVEVGVQQQSGGTQDIGTRWDGAAFIARASLHQLNVGGGTLVNDARSLPPVKATNDLVSNTEFNQLVDTAAWYARSRPLFHVTHNTTQTISQGTPTTLTFDSEITDLHNGWVTNRYTAPISGVYIFGGSVYIANADTAMNIRLALRENGVSEFYIRQKQSTIVQPIQFPPTPVFLNAGNFVELRMQYDFGTTGTKVLGTGSAAGNKYTHCFYGWLEMAG